MGVGVPHRGHVTVRPSAGVATGRGALPDFGATLGGTVGGRSAPGRGTDGSGPPPGSGAVGIGPGPPSGPGGGMRIGPPMFGPSRCGPPIGPGGGIPGGGPGIGPGPRPGIGPGSGPGPMPGNGWRACDCPPGGGAVGARPAGMFCGEIGGPCIGGGYAGAPAVSALPQLRQNFMPGGFSPRQTLQVLDVGNRLAAAGVCPSALPQFRQNDDPGGLSWPHIEQRIGPLTLNPFAISQQSFATGIAAGRFATCGAG